MKFQELQIFSDRKILVSDWERLEHPTMNQNILQQLLYSSD